MGKRGVPVGFKASHISRLRQSLTKRGDSIPLAIQDELIALISGQSDTLTPAAKTYALTIPVCREHPLLKRRKRPKSQRKHHGPKKRSRYYAMFLERTGEDPVVTRGRAMRETELGR